jgi:hypothetical protein
MDVAKASVEAFQTYVNGCKQAKDACEAEPGRWIEIDGETKLDFGPVPDVFKFVTEDVDLKGVAEGVQAYFKQPRKTTGEKRKQKIIRNKRSRSRIRTKKPKKKKATSAEKTWTYVWKKGRYLQVMAKWILLDYMHQGQC